jgi:hypothetical protein
MIAVICATVLSLPTNATATLSPRADLGHPLAQRRDRDLAADDDDREVRVGAAERDEQDQRGRHHQLVGDRVEERAERAGQPELPREPAVEPVGDRRDREDAHREPVLARGREPGVGR